ncbi:hypothetical protein ZIOFF_002707 [Zingiber officinale]|uniref:DUF4378 domain-containing protein n=1 Tax=Zingiber officinale TaxID=94328 RepID=A0A8J5I030_ZINOF|nr:hypothetical protein ZIOFF_002707 [Zingiber officinale]
MAPTAGRGLLEHKHFERQMGCTGGFLNLFDRHQILARKRLPPPPMVMGSFASPSERSDASSASMKDSLRSASPDFHSPPWSHHLPHHEVKDDSSRAPLKPRDARHLSRDGESKIRGREALSAASVGEQYEASETAEEIDRKRRSPSVVARLMGLDALPVSPVEEGGGESGWTELRRSGSECRVSREASSYRFLDGEMFPKRSPLETDRVSVDEWIRMANLGDIRFPEARKPKFQAKTSRLPPLQTKSFFDADEFFPEPKKRGYLPIQLEKQHLIRGMDEASNLEKLKQILEALQLKGLLHSKPSGHQINGRRDRYARFSDYSPIVVIEPVPSPHMPPSTEPRQQVTFKSIPGRRNHVEEAVIPSLRQNRRVNQNPSSCNGTKDRAPSSSAKRRVSNVVDSAKSLPPRPRTSTSIPPKKPPHRVGTIPTSGRPHSNRRQKQEATSKPRINSPEENANATAATTTLDVEKSWAEDYRAGRQLLERCDQLLNSIAAFTAAEQVAVAVDPVANAATELQPSPVSVLEVTSPPRSPLTKRSIDFEGEQLPDREEEVVASNDGDDRPAKQEEQEEGGQGDEDDDDDDYVYVAQVLRASDNHGDGGTDVYALLEKRRSAVESVPFHRRLLFDAVAEILDKKSCSSHPPWESFVRPGSLSAASRNAAGPMLPEVWSELRRAREPVSADDVNVVTCLAARRDLEQDDRDTWARPAAEVAEAAIQIERLIFKDLLDGAILHFTDTCPPHDAKPSKSNACGSQKPAECHLNDKDGGTKHMESSEALADSRRGGLGWGVGSDDQIPTRRSSYPNGRMRIGGKSDSVESDFRSIQSNPIQSENP